MKSHFPLPHYPAIVIAGFALTMSTASAAPIVVSSYVYGADAESQPQPTNFQGGLISDVGNLKLIDGQLATGSWNDGTNVGFRNDSDNGNPQPQIIFDLGQAHSVTTVNIWTVSAFLGSNESVSISSSPNGTTFSSPIVVNPIIWTDGFANGNLRQSSIDVSALPIGRFYRIDVFDSGQWMMINEVGFDGTPDGIDTTPPTLSPSDILDDKDGGATFQDSLVTYSLSFSDDMDETTINVTDFDNAGTATITIGNIIKTGLGTFTVEVTPTTTGTLQLRLPIGATLTDDAGNPLDTSSAIVDDTSITVAPPDTTTPTLLGSDIVDDRGGNPIPRGTLVTYTITFSEDMDTNSFNVADLANAGDATLTIGAIIEISSGVFTVAVTPTTPGNLQLEISSGATLTDPSGNSLNTTSAILDDTILTVEETLPGSISVVSYEYGENPESQPQPTDFQGGSISDVGNLKLTDGQIATGSWDDGTNVGFRNDTDNGAPQPQITFDLGVVSNVTSIDLLTVEAFLGNDESVSVSSSIDGESFSAPITINPITWTSGFANGLLRQSSVNVFTLPEGRYYKIEIFDLGQWMMLNEVVFYSTTAGTGFASWIAGFPDVGGLNGFDEDADGDGNSNGIENFFGTSPDSFTQGLVPDSMSDGIFTFTHPQGILADDLTANYRWSKDLQTFNADGDTDGAGTTVVFSTQPDTPSEGITTVTATVSGNPTPKMFIDVEVNQTP